MKAVWWALGTGPGSCQAIWSIILSMFKNLRAYLPLLAEQRWDKRGAPRAGERKPQGREAREKTAEPTVPISLGSAV